MPFCQWSETMSVGESLLDADHKSLVLLINRLHDSLEAGENPAALGVRLTHVKAATREWQHHCANTMLLR